MTPELEALAVLAARVETLAGPNREVDCLIWCAANGITPEWQGACLVAGKEGVIGYIDPGIHQRNFSTNRASQGPGSIPAYTASLDAAMTLVPEGIEGAALSFKVERIHLGNGIEKCRSSVWDGLGIVSSLDTASDAATPALALCAAALRAITPTQNHKGPHDE